MRAFLGFLFAVSLGACAASSSTTPESIEVVYHPGTMFYTIEDGGSARVVGADNSDFAFEANHEDFRRIADLLAPLQAEGLTCSTPSEHLTPGYIVWRRAGLEHHRVAMINNCYADPANPLKRNADSAYYAMVEMGRARYVAPAIPDPAVIAVERAYWGTTTSRWSVARSGDGSFTRDGRTQSFAISRDAFDRIRDIFRPYEGRHFECRRVITDGPYGYVIWSSRPGAEDQRTGFDAGCVTGDATDLFERLDRAERFIDTLRGSEAH